MVGSVGECCEGRGEGRKGGVGEIGEVYLCIICMMSGHNARSGADADPDRREGAEERREGLWDEEVQDGCKVTTLADTRRGWEGA